MFDILNCRTKNCVLNAPDNSIVDAAFGVQATPRLKHELRQYELELAGTNDTVLAENGFLIFRVIKYLIV